MKHRPATTVLLTAAGFALFGSEIALGALLGGATALLVSKKTGPEVRHELRERARRLLHRAEEKQGEMPPREAGSQAH